MTKDARDNKRGCFVIGAIVALVLVALAWAIFASRDDSRTEVPGSDGGVAVDSGTGRSPPPKTDTPE